MVDAYDEVVYPGHAHRLTHPAHLEVVARLFGLPVTPAARCRVLELGCGDGVNALAIAQTLPGAEVIGIDRSSGAIERGLALARDAGLGNVELRVGDLGDDSLPDEVGSVDYVIAHGVYSWIPPAIRGALLAACRRVLSPSGLAFVSYNAYPGSYLRDMARDILAFHLQGVTAPAARLAGAHELMQAIVAAPSPTPYAAVLREHMQRMLNASDALLYHDDLAAVSTPFYFHEFMEHAVAHDLQFLAEADLGDSQLRDAPTEVAELMAQLPAEVVVREQYLDFLRNRMFRQTLLIGAGAPVRRAIDARQLDEMAISSPARLDDDGWLTPSGSRLRSANPVVNAVMQELSVRWPASLPFGELCHSVGQRAAPNVVGNTGASLDELRATLLDAYLAHVIRLDTVAPPVNPSADGCPRAAPLARAQCAAGDRVVATLLATNHMLESDTDRRLLRLLDGTRDGAALAAELGTTELAVREALDGLARSGLLAA